MEKILQVYETLETIFIILLINSVHSNSTGCTKIIKITIRGKNKLFFRLLRKISYLPIYDFLYLTTF